MKHRFTLLELGLMGVLGLLLAALAVPYVVAQRRAAELRFLMVNGRNICLAMHYAGDYEESDFARRVWRMQSASPGEFPTSTDLFREWFDLHGSHADFSFFGGCGVPRNMTKDPRQFTAENNAWCVVSGLLDTSQDMVPALFTRNVDAREIGPDLAYRLGDGAPFGRDAWVFVAKDASAHHVRGDFIAYWNTGREAHSVLRP